VRPAATAALAARSDSPGARRARARQRPGTPHRSHARHDHQNPASPRCSSATFRNGTRSADLLIPAGRTRWCRHAASHVYARDASRVHSAARGPGADSARNFSDR